MSANESDALFDIIQKEMNKIMEHSENEQAISRTNKNQETKNIGGVLSSQIAGGAEDRVNDSEILSLQSTALEKEIEWQTKVLESPRGKSIDTDLKKMQLKLEDCYNAFQTISQKFEVIDFGCLQKRIKDLNLSTKREIIGLERSNVIRKAVDVGFEKNRLNDFTQVGEKFREHPGEFGNIPELSSFFQACTQLEHCLGNLKRHHNDIRDLESRMRRAAEMSVARTNHIQQQLAADNFEEDFGL